MTFVRVQAGRALWLAAALAFPTVAVHAAPPVGIKTLAQEMSPPIARCLIRREPALVERWLRTLPGSVWEERLFRAPKRASRPASTGPSFLQGASRVPVHDRAGMRAALVRALLQARRADLPAAPPEEAAWHMISGGPDSFPSLPREEMFNDR